MTAVLRTPYPQSLGEVAYPSVLILSDETGESVDQRFQDDPQLMSVVVRHSVERDRVGSLSRLAFYRAMSGRLGFGHALYNRRPIEEQVTWDPLQLDACTSIVSATAMVLARGERRYEDVVVTWNDSRVAVASPQVLFEVLAGLYGHQAMHDHLTGLANRVLLNDRLQHSLEAARRTNARPAVLFIDLDDFKSVNDALGHDCGDRLLVMIGDRLRTVVRPGDTLARMGGDEFAVLLPEDDGETSGMAVAERILRAIGEGFYLDGHEVRPTASVGVAWADEDAGAQTLLRNADLAMYAAKREGKGRCRMFESELQEVAMLRRRTEAELRTAVAEGQLRLHYQPIVALPDLRWVGVEALVRWQHPARGLLMPDVFIALAEETGLIAEIDAWVLREACRQLAVWQSLRHGVDLRMAVNLSAANFTSPRIVEAVRQALAENGLRPESLELEITETLAVSQEVRIEQRLRQLRDLGVRVSMDDFGVGHSSLSRLIQFPLDAVKVDRSFVRALDSGHAERKLVSALIATCQDLGLEIVAEGVEQQAHLDFLIERRCELAQGYFLGHPRSAEEITPGLRTKAPVCTGVI